MKSYFLNNAQNITNYGFEVKGSTYDPVFSKSYLSTIPNISIAGTSCFIDYSECYNNSDRTTLIKLFKNTASGITFAFSNANYYDESNSILKDVSGVFSLESIKNDKLIIGGIVSGFTYETSYSFYSRENFTYVPQYTTGYTGSFNSNYILNNLNDLKSKSILNKGILGSIFSKEEYVEIQGSTLNSGKIVVQGAIQLKDKKEILYLGQTLTNETYHSSEKTISQYLRGESNAEILSKSKNALGCYLVFDENGNQINCFEKQNELQAYLRSQYEGSTYSTQWVLCDSCDRLYSSTHNASNTNKSYEFDACVFAKIETNTLFNNETNTSLLVSYPSSYILRASSSIAVSISNGFKMDLSHPSLKGYAVSVYSDVEKTSLVKSDLYYYGVPGFDQSSIVFVKQRNGPRNIYFDFVGPSTYQLEVIIG